VAVIVANLPVIVSWIYRLKHKRDEGATHSRFTTDYDHNRRAKSGAWAQRTRDLTSTSDPASKGHLTSPAIQLGDVRRPNMHRHSTIRGEDVLDLSGRRRASDDLDADVKALDSFDDQVVKVSDFDPERSYDSRHSTPADRKQRNDGPQDGGVDFTVSAISYGGGRRLGRDAEYGIDVVDDLDADGQHHLSSTGITVTNTHGSMTLRYPTYSSYSTDSPPFTQNRIPISAEHHDGGNSYSDGEHSFLSPALLDVPASVHSPPTSSRFTLPSPPPPAAGILSQQQQPGRTTSPRRSPPSATRPATSPSDERSRRQQRSQYPSRSPSPSSRSRARVAFDGLFGGGNGGVLVQQQVHVVADPEDEVANNGAPRGRSS
jgi:hypothetical protein